MLEFMDYVQAAFCSTTRWNVDNSYASLTTTASNLLDFHIPHGVRLNVSSLSAPNAATSYTLGNQGVVHGSLSFLYSSVGLGIRSKSGDVALEAVVRGYRHLQELRKVEEAKTTRWALRGGRPRDSLLYGRLYLPGSTLEALFLHRLSPARLLRLTCVSDGALPNGGTLLATLQNDHGKYSTEFLYSTDSSLLGFRGLYNFGHDPREPVEESDPAVSSRPAAHPWDRQNGRLSAGAEVYFSPVNKSGGLSTGLRFTTLPTHLGFPYTMTLTVNPLMGNLSSTFAVKAGPELGLCSRFDFNVYSYESNVDVGMELWHRKPTVTAPAEVAWARRLLRPDWAVASNRAADVNGVLKARVDNRGRLRLLWECRLKELLLSVGAGFDLKKRDRMLGTVGVEISYSS